jgi:hypothetical protein
MGFAKPRNPEQSKVENAERLAPPLSRPVATIAARTGPMSQRSCAQCGQPLPEHAQFCGQCGAFTPAPQLQVTSPVMNRPAALSTLGPGTLGATQAPVRSASPIQSAPGDGPSPQAQGDAPVMAPPTGMPSLRMDGPGAMPPPAAVPAAPRQAAPAPPPDLMKRTMMGFGAAVPAPSPLASTTASPGQAARGALGSTMLGLAPRAAPLDPAAAPPRAPVAPAAKLANRTMLGVARPGIAPLRPGDDSLPPSQPVIAQPPLLHREPLHRGVDAPLPSILPAPAPLDHIAAPPPPRIVRKRGVPLAVVGLAAGGLLLAGGAIIALLWHGAPPITALPRVTPEGADVLHLSCDPASCKDGTVVTVEGASATFTAGASDLPLAQPLHVGNNALSLHVDRPGMGRDEVIALSVPVGYRVRADVSAMNGPRPSVLIHVEALAGSEIRIADKPVTLDASGAGTYAIDETAATEGPADESRVISLDVPYAVSGGGRPPEAGTVSARVSVAPLHVDAPGSHAVVDTDHIVLAGRAAKGATVTVDGASAVVAADGTFEMSIALLAPGERSVEVRSGTATLAPRTVRVPIKRVTSLVSEARAFEKLSSPLGYDAALANLATDAGRAIVVDGEVVEPRASGQRTLLLIDDRRGCARGPCLARVVVGQELAVARGDRLRAYGRVERAFTTPGGQTVPEVEADFVLRPKR